MRGFLIVVFCMLGSSIVFGQVTISGSFVQDTVVIGDDVDFTISLEVDENVEVLGVATYFLDSIYSALQSVNAQTDTTQPILPTIADYELISNGGWEDLNDDGVFAGDELSWNTTTNGSIRLLEKSFTVKFWDPGNNIVLYPTVVYAQNNIQDQYSQEGEMVVFVAPPGGLPPVQDSLNVAPIKTIKQEASNFSDYVVYFIIVGIAVLLGLIYWIYTRYFNNKEIVQNQVVEEIYIVPHEVALEKLQELQAKKLWQKGNIKLYQSELTHIIREYLEGRYDIAALESTTDEIIESLSEALKSNEDVVSLKRILQVADLVKFAKAKPDENVHQTFMNEAESFVERTGDEEKKIRIQ